MKPIELLNVIARWESSTVQFKERVNDAYSIATEMVAFSNSLGGFIIIGVNDKTGDLNGLSYGEIQATNQLLANAASDNVKSPITIFTGQVSVNEQTLIFVCIKEGSDKPYRDNKGIIWVKNGSDKKKVVSNDKLLRMLQSSGNLTADEEPVVNSTFNDIDISVFKDFVRKKTGKGLDTLYENLTLSGLLLFGKNPQRYKPMFTVLCVSFAGNEISGTEFRDKTGPFAGNIVEILEKTMNFIIRNLHVVQVEKSFNSSGRLEIPREVLEELIVNALIHHDYFISSTIKVFIFDNRVEIISPGKLRNTLSVENIKAGTSNARNSILYTNARYLLPFMGVGSGIPREISLYQDIEFINDREINMFTSIIKRPQ